MKSRFTFIKNKNAGLAGNKLSDSDISGAFHKLHDANRGGWGPLAFCYGIKEWA
jgi:hypothetical protein